MNESLNPINNIVATTDFSINGDLAVRRAAQIAQKSGKALHLLHIVHPLEIYPELMITFDSHLKSYERSKKANELESLNQLASKIRKEFDIEVLTVARIGRAYKQIAEFAKEQSADLVVVGFRGETNLLDAVMGSTTSRLLHATPCAVLAVRASKVVPYKQVVAAVDLSPDSLRISSMACAVASGAPVEVLHVFDLQERIIGPDIDMSESEVEKLYGEAMKHVDAELDKLLTEVGYKHILSMVLDGYSPEVISSRVIETNADLVVLGKNSKNAIQEFMLGSVSKAVLEMVNCDVLIT